MSRVKISEYRAKKILLGDAYEGIQLHSGSISIPEGHFAAKVDQGVKKRFKQGLVTIDKPPAEIERAIHEWEHKGFSQFILEPLVAHEPSEEQYLSLERVRNGIRLLHAKDGGIDIEAHPENVHTHVLTSADDAVSVARDTGLPEDFLRSTIDSFERSFFAFLEINPLVVRDGRAFLLDAAVLVDSAGEFFVRGAWTDRDIVQTASKHPAEDRILALAATTPASLKLSVIHPDGSLFFLLSAGGGSIVIADAVQIAGMGKELANYGEYSGGPTREETYLYAKEILALMLESKSTRKGLVIAGPMANFTDVKKTFLGIIDALSEVVEKMQEQKILVYVRRGGPNEAAGLSLMRDFLEKNGLLGSVHGSDAVITIAVEEAIEHLRA
jgi:succinyl-CoA synthetase beta subunit